MKIIIHKIQLAILVISLASAATIAQTIPRDSMKVDTTKTQKIAAKIDTIKKNVTIAVDKAVDKITPSKPTEVARISTPSRKVILTSDPTSDGVFHAGSLVLGVGVVYQKDLLPLMLTGEYGIGRNIGVEVKGWYGSKTKDGILYRDGLFGVGLNYHFTGNITSSESKFDASVGGLYGKILDQTGSAFYAQAGMKYFFIGRLGVFGNFNIGLVGSRGSNLSVGLAYTLF